MGEARRCALWQPNCPIPTAHQQLAFPPQVLPIIHTHHLGGWGGATLRAFSRNSAPIPLEEWNALLGAPPCSRGFTCLLGRELQRNGGCGLILGSPHPFSSTSGMEEGGTGS